MNIFSSVIPVTGITGSAFFLCTAVSLAIGLGMSVIYARKTRYSKSFLITLALLPAIVQMVIMLVNGNVGAGVAVAGAFSLVRFRSVAGSAQEITSVFLSMAVGLTTGMGYLAMAAVFSLILVAVHTLLLAGGFGERNEAQRILKITIPEELDYEEVFDEILRQDTVRYELMEVKTTNLGSLYRVTYQIVLKRGISAREVIDALRIRNGNLEISCGRPVTSQDTL